MKVYVGLLLLLILCINYGYSRHIGKAQAAKKHDAEYEELDSVENSGSGDSSGDIEDEYNKGDNAPHQSTRISRKESAHQSIKTHKFKSQKHHSGRQAINPAPNVGITLTPAAIEARQNEGVEAIMQKAKEYKDKAMEYDSKAKQLENEAQFLEEHGNSDKPVVPFIAQTTVTPQQEHHDTPKYEAHHEEPHHEEVHVEQPHHEQPHHQQPCCTEEHHHYHLQENPHYDEHPPPHPMPMEHPMEHHHMDHPMEHHQMNTPHHYGNEGIQIDAEFTPHSRGAPPIAINTGYGPEAIPNDVMFPGQGQQD